MSPRPEEHLGRLVAHLRDERELTQTDLAQAAGVDPVTIARVEQGRGPGWWRKTARNVFLALAAAKPISPAEAEHYFTLSKYRPTEYELQKAIAEGAIRASDANAKPPPIPNDIHDMLGKMLFSFGEHRVRALLRTMLSLAIDQEAPPASVPSDPATSVPAGRVRVPNAVAIDIDTEPDIALRKFIPSSTEPRVPGAKPARRNKSG